MAARRPKAAAGRRSVRHLLLLSLALSLLALSSFFSPSSLLANANALGRSCMPESTKYAGVTPPRRPMRIGMVSLSDERDGGRRSFRGLMEVVARNKRAYAARMGYEFIDAGELVDPSRPPSWSKILAIRAHLRDYDWLFWNDADTIVTNHDVSLEGIILSAIGNSKFDVSPDLIVTEDINGVNAGVFFVRGSNWSEAFLDEWWNQTSFIRFGSTKSGDNDALKYLIKSMPQEQFHKHIRLSSMQCLFNSYPWSATWVSIRRLISSPQIIWKGVYSKGDFMVHLAGLDDKKKWTYKILQEINNKD